MLEGLRILAVEQYGAGPFGTQYLADLGAEVIKVENRHTGGDYARYVGPHFIAPPEQSGSLFFQSINRNKYSLSLDLSKPQGQEVLHRLASQVDAIANNLRGDVPGKLGITHAALKAVNPKLVCVHCSAYGRDNQRATWPGYDYLMQAEAGYFSLTGEPESPPNRFGLSVVDYMAGLSLAFAVVSGVLVARQSGVGKDIDVSLFDTALFNLNYVAAWALNGGHIQGRTKRSAHPVLTPTALYQTQDGWIYLMCNKEKFWGVLCQKIGRPEWASDPRFINFEQRLKHRDLITEMLDKALSQRTTQAWLETFAGSVPAAPIYDVEQALDNPFVHQTQRLQTLEHQNGQGFRLVATPIRVEGEEAPNRPAPLMGQDTQRILQELGYSPSDIQQLETDKII